MSTVESRVRAGATFLDLNVVGWAGQIKIAKLDLGVCWGCMIGQLFSVRFEERSSEELGNGENEYTFGCRTLGIAWGPHSQAVSLGFHAAASLTVSEAQQLSEDERKDHTIRLWAEYGALRTAWLREIALRLGTPEAEEARVEATPVDVGNVWGAL